MSPFNASFLFANFIKPMLFDESKIIWEINIYLLYKQ